MKLNEALQYIIENKGKEALSDPKIMKSFLTDLSPDSSKDISVIVHASADHCFDGLAFCGKDQIQTEINAARLKMESTFAAGAVDRIIEALYQAFGIKKEQIQKPAEINSPKNDSKDRKPALQRLQESKSIINNTSNVKNTRGVITGSQEMYLYEKVLIFTYLFSMIIDVLVNKQMDPDYFLDYVLYGCYVIPFILSWGVTKEKARKTPLHCIGLTVFTGVILIIVGVESSSKIKYMNSLSLFSTANEQYLWQRHLVIENILMLCTLSPVFLRLVWHRILERKKNRQ